MLPTPLTKCLKIGLWAKYTHRYSRGRRARIRIRSGAGVRLHFSDSDTELSFREKPDPVCMVWYI